MFLVVAVVAQELLVLLVAGPQTAASVFRLLSQALLPTTQAAAGELKDLIPPVKAVRAAEETVLGDIAAGQMLLPGPQTLVVVAVGVQAREPRHQVALLVGQAL
jgi:hypothetical protein